MPISALYFAVVVAVICSVTKAEGHGHPSHLVSIPSNVDLEIFLIDKSIMPYNFTLRFPQKEGSLLPQPCPTCDPTYDKFPLTAHQTLLPLVEKLLILSFVEDFGHTLVAYVQVIDAPGCSPLSIFKPPFFDIHNYLFVLCKNRSENYGYFIGKVTISNTKMSFHGLIESYKKAGVFQTYYDANYELLDTYFIHAVENSKAPALHAESLDGGPTIVFHLPENCSKVVRMTPLGEKNGGALIECSTGNEPSPATVNNVYSFSFEHGFTTVLSNLSYQLCPLCATQNHSIVAIFTQNAVILKRLEKAAEAVYVKASEVIYDGQLAEFDGKVIAVYSTSEGLYRLDVGVALNKGTSPATLLASSQNVCAQSGCALLEIVAGKNVVAATRTGIALFSLESFSLIGAVKTKHQPSRFFFHNSTSFLPPTTRVPPTYTHTSAPTSVVPPDDKLTGPAIAGVTIAGVLVTIASAIVLLVAGVYGGIKLHTHLKRRRRMRSDRNRYVTIEMVPMAQHDDIAGAHDPIGDAPSDVGATCTTTCTAQGESSPTLQLRNDMVLVQ